MSNELSTLTAAVAAAVSIETAAVDALNGIKSRLDAALAANDPIALQALSDNLGAENAALAAAIAAVAPAPAPTPAV